MNKPFPINTLQLFVVPDLPNIRPGDSLLDIIHNSLIKHDILLKPYDIVVIAQKIVSKSEGRFLRLSQLSVSERATQLAALSGKDAKKIEAILGESDLIMRVAASPPNGLIVSRHHHGWVCANAGIDESNLGQEVDNDEVLLLPKDPDASAQSLREPLEKAYSKPIGVVISDTFGRAWRKGQVNVAIGIAGIPAMVSLVGQHDAYGKKLTVSQPAFSDEIAAAAGLLMGKATRTPVVIVRGLSWTPSSDASARDIIRPIEEELFI